MFYTFRVTDVLLRIMMVSKSRVLVIIPAYNEEDNIVATVQSVVGCGYDYVVVNDGSTDCTLQVCKDNGINVLDLPQNLGIGGAVQAGHKYARRFGYDIDVRLMVPATTTHHIFPAGLVRLKMEVTS